MIVSFHKHEVVGAAIAQETLETWGVNPTDIKTVRILVAMHQTRVDPERTKDDTYRNIIRKLNGTSLQIDRLFQVMRYDRRGNRRKLRLPATTWYMSNFEEKLRALLPNTVIPNDFTIPPGLLVCIPKDQLEPLKIELCKIFQKNRKKMNSQFITEYIRKRYVEKKNGNSKGIPHW